MMAKGRYTIIVVPGGNQEVRRFHFSKRFFQYALISLAAIFLIGAGSTILYVRLLSDSNRIAKENAELRANIERSQVLAEKLNRKISSLARLSAQLKAAAGFSKDSRRVSARPGMGGVSMDHILNPSELDALEKKAELLERNLLSLHTYVEKYHPFTTPSILPTSGFISSSFGSRRNPFTGLPDFHEGMDISNSSGTPVFAPADGIVSASGYRGTLGLTVILQHDDELSTVFGHLGLVLVKSGEKVKRGEKIGLMGNSGLSTGPHLHYEVRVNNQPVNPKSYLKTAHQS